MPASNEAVEAVSEILSRVGYGGVAVEEPLEADSLHVVKAYVPYDHAARVRVRRVKTALGRLAVFGLAPMGELEVRPIVERDWLEAWREHYRPLVVGRFLVKPTWIDVPSDGRLVVELDPGLAFGTGLHPTTQQALQAMSRLDLAGRSVLDVGTGSGILALAAIAAGASRVVAVDVDPVAVRAARDNVARANAARGNPADAARGDVDVREGSARDVSGTFDVVLANIVAKVIVTLASELRTRTAPAGTLVVAGIIQDAEAETIAALERAGLRVSERDVQGDWVSLILLPLP